jgi:hypothetical protein
MTKKFICGLKGTVASGCIEQIFEPSTVLENNFKMLSNSLVEIQDGRIIQDGGKS